MTEQDSYSPPILYHPPQEDLVLSEVLFALSDPARLEIVRQIASGALEMAQCHLQNPDAPKSTKSHHMKVLREAGVMRNEPAGRGRLLSLRLEDLDRRFPGLMRAILAAEPG